ncbi:unnamed protein product [Rotaria sp. Silwood1]|nr:unnamed protein product [Rotaria sp. Silwood1]CAF4651400.1 unnamed protein product [Rotaria sp. Silwood1]
MNAPFEFGKADTLIDGNDVTLIANGLLVWEAIIAADKLKKDGINARVINMHTIKPIDVDVIVKAANETGLVITCEDHQKQCGLYGAVAEVLSLHKPTQMDYVAVEDTFGESGTMEQLMRQQSGPQKQIVRGLGSGYIISQDGYILTNDHVAGNATKISVTLTTGETVSAKLIGSDPNTDVALLKIDKGNLPYIALGNSDDVIIGEWAIALGNPFGLFEINDKPSVTVGVISAVNMKVAADGRRSYINMIQTDASINAGNSGGPLVNVDGEVIGMNTIIYTGGNGSNGSIGVGFAISINRAIDERIAKYYNLEDTKGVIVNQVAKGGAADDAGLKTEDVITQANGEPIRNEQDILTVVNDLRPSRLNRDGFFYE